MHLRVGRLKHGLRDFLETNRTITCLAYSSQSSRWFTNLIAEQPRLLHHHPHLRRDVSRAFMLPRTFVPLRQETIIMAIFAPEIDRPTFHLLGR